MAELTLPSGDTVIFDDADLPLVEGKAWWAVKARNTRYAAWSTGGAKHRKDILMHRLLTNAPKGKVVDHINHNGLDNRRENLRVCTHAENCHNQRVSLTRKKSSKYKGVHWWQYVGLWASAIHCSDDRTYIGSFKREKDAALSRDLFELKMFGKFANLNFPDSTGREREAAYARRVKKPKTAAYRGVSAYGKVNTYYPVQIYDARTGTRLAVPGFTDPESAAREYDRLAKKLKGKKAKLNFPKEHVNAHVSCRDEGARSGQIRDSRVAG